MANSFEIARLKQDNAVLTALVDKHNDRLTSVERFQWMIIGGLLVGNFLQIALKFIKP